MAAGGVVISPLESDGLRILGRRSSPDNRERSLIMYYTCGENGSIELRAEDRESNSLSGFARARDIFCYPTVLSPAFSLGDGEGENANDKSHFCKSMEFRDVAMSTRSLFSFYPFSGFVSLFVCRNLPLTLAFIPLARSAEFQQLLCESALPVLRQC